MMETCQFIAANHGMFVILYIWRKWQEAVVGCMIRTFITCMLDQIMEVEVSRSCTTHGEIRIACKILVRKPERKGLEADEGIILEWILQKWGGKVWTGFILLRIGSIGNIM
jgi:hypothetical protein